MGFVPVAEMPWPVVGVEDVCEACGVVVGLAFTVFFFGDSEREVLACESCAEEINKMLGFPCDLWDE